MSSRAGPSRVSRPRRSSVSTSKGSTASSTGTDEGARMGASGVILVSDDSESMALYLGSEDGNRKGVTVVPAKAGTHNPGGQLLCETSTTSRYTRDHAVWVPAFAGTTMYFVSAATPPRQST